MKRLVSILALTFLAACGDFSQTIRPTEVTLTVDRTSGAVGEPFEFEYTAQGRSMAGIIIDYGDGGLDSIPFNGAVTASKKWDRAYETAGTFIVSARLEELLGGAAGAEVVVTVTP